MSQSAANGASLVAAAVQAAVRERAPRRTVAAVAAAVAGTVLSSTARVPATVPDVRAPSAQSNDVCSDDPALLWRNYDQCVVLNVNARNRSAVRRSRPQWTHRLLKLPLSMAMLMILSLLRPSPSTLSLDYQPDIKPYTKMCSRQLHGR